MAANTRLTVLISGNGSNLQALIDATTTTTPNPLTARIVRVISNRKKAHGLVRAAKAQIPTAYHNLLDYKSRLPDDETRARQDYDRDLAELVLRDMPDLVVCAGWMHILAPAFLDVLSAADVPVINLHPALPGQFNGAHAIERAHRAFAEGEITKTGIMIHHVVPEVDMGPPIVTRDVEMRKGESFADLEERMHAVEHELIVQGTQMAIDRLKTSHTSRRGHVTISS